VAIIIIKHFAKTWIIQVITNKLAQVWIHTFISLSCYGTWD
jgi:hypothetical protein